MSPMPHGTMPPILKWRGTPSRQLSQQCTIFSETTGRTSSIFAIYTMVAFVVVIGSLFVPHTAGHSLEEHWKGESLHRKRFPTTLSDEQGTSRGLHSSSSRTFPTRRSSLLRYTDKKSTTVSWLLSNYGKSLNSSAGNKRFRTAGVVNSIRSWTGDHRNRKSQTANTGLRIENTATALPLRLTLRQTVGSMRTNSVGLGRDLSAQRNKQEGKHHGTDMNTKPVTHDFFRNQHKESPDARRTFSQKITNKDLVATKRKSIERTGSLTPVRNRNDDQLEDNGEVTNNIPKSVLFRQQAISLEKEKNDNIYHTLTESTQKSKNISPEVSTKSVQIIKTFQDAITGKLSESPFPWRLFSTYSFQGNRNTNAPTQMLLNLSTNPGLSSVSRDSGRPMISTANHGRPSTTPLSMSTRSSTMGDTISFFDEGFSREKDISITGTSSSVPATVSTTETERRRRRRKKGQRKKKRQNTNRPAGNKRSQNRQRSSADKKAEKINRAEKETEDAAREVERQSVQRLNTSYNSSNDSDIDPAIDIDSMKMESKRLRSSRRRYDQPRLNHIPVSVEVGSDGSGEVHYPVVREGSTKERQTRLKGPQPEDRLSESDHNIHISDATRGLFKTGLPFDDGSDHDLSPKTNQSPAVFRFSTQKRKGNRIRDRNNKRKLFSKRKLPNFESSKSSKRDPIIKDFSSRHFAKMAFGLKTTVKRSAPPVETITAIPTRNKNGADSKRWKFKLRTQKNKPNDSNNSSDEKIIRGRSRFSFYPNPVKPALIHSKGHSLFDHDEEPASENVNEAKILTSSSSMQTTPAMHQITQDRYHQRKDTVRVMTTIYDRLDPNTSTVFSFVNRKSWSNQGNIGLLPTESTYSVLNDTTRAPTRLSSRIIRGTDGSKPSQTFMSTASLKDVSDGVTDRPVLHTKPKPDPSATTKDLNIQLRSTAGIVSTTHTQTTQSSILPPFIEVTSVQSTQRAGTFPAKFQSSGLTSKLAPYVTVSSTRQKHDSGNRSSAKNVVPMEHLSSSPGSAPTKDNLDSLVLHKNHTNSIMGNKNGITKQSTTKNPREASEVTFGETSSRTNTASYRTTSIILPAIWKLSTPGSTYKQHGKHVEKNTQLPFTESGTTKRVASTYSNLETSRIFITSTKPGSTDDKMFPNRTIHPKVQHHSRHSTTSSSSSFLTSATSKSRFSLTSTPTSVKTESTTGLSADKSSSFSTAKNKMATTSFVHRTPDTIVSTSATILKDTRDHEPSTEIPLGERPQNTKTEPLTTRTSTFSPTKTTKASGRIVSTPKFSRSMDATRKPLNSNRNSATTLDARAAPRTEATTRQRMSSTTLSKNILTNKDNSVPTQRSTNPGSLLRPSEGRPKSQLPPGSSGHDELIVKCKVKKNIDIKGKDFIKEIKNGLVYSYLEGRTLLILRKAGSTNNRRGKRETIGYVLEQNIDTHAMHFVDTEGIEAKILRVSRRGKLVEVYFQMHEYELVIDTDTAIKVFSQLQITEISVNLHYPIYHQIEAIKHVMFQSQHPLQPSATKWMMVTIAAPSIPVICVICILLTSWYRNHARLRRKAMAEISRGSQYAESLADVGLEIDMEKGEIVSRAGSTSVLWTEFAAGDTLERVGMAGEFPNTDSESSRSNSWNARGNSRAGANPGGQGRRQSPVTKQCQKYGKYVKKKDSVSSFHFDHNLEDEWLGCLLTTDYTDPVDLKKEWLQLHTFQSPPVYESFIPDLSDTAQWPKTSTLQSRKTSGRQQQRKDNSSTSQIYGDSILISSQKLRPTLHANIISHFLAELDTL